MTAATYSDQLLSWKNLLIHSFFKSILFIYPLQFKSSIPGSSASSFVTERMTVTHSLKGSTLWFSFVGPLSFAVTHCHFLSLIVIHCHSMYHSSAFLWTIAVLCENLLLLNTRIFFFGTFHLFAQFIGKNFS